MSLCYINTFFLFFFFGMSYGVRHKKFDLPDHFLHTTSETHPLVTDGTSLSPMYERAQVKGAGSVYKAVVRFHVRWYTTMTTAW